MQLSATQKQIRKHGLCVQEEPLTDLFFSEWVQDIHAAKMICAECSVLDMCLQEAIDTEEECGVWGGQLFKDGKIVAYKKNRGRPSRDRINETFTDDVAVPEHLQQTVQNLLIEH